MPDVTLEPAQDGNGRSRLATDIDDILFALEHGSTVDFIKDYIDYETYSQVFVHNATFPERESMRKLLEGFEQDVAPDLLRDLKACKSLDPEIVEQEEGWYAAIYGDPSLSAELVLAYDPEYREDWFLIQVPLTTPWGDALPPSRQWDEWLADVDSASGGGARNRGLLADPQMNPAAVLYATHDAFGVGRGGVNHDIATYAKVLRPESRRLVAAILYKRLMTQDNVSQHADAFRAIVRQHSIDGSGIAEGFQFPSEAQDLAFYFEFAQRIPEAQAASFIVEAEALLKTVTGEHTALLYPGGSWQNPRPRWTEDGVLVEVGWGYTNDRRRRGPTIDAMFFEVDGKWYVESYWEAWVRDVENREPTQ